MRDSPRRSTTWKPERYYAALVDSADIAAGNRELILQFYALCRAQGLSDSRLCKTLWIMRNLGNWMGPRSFETATKREIIDLVNVIHSKYTNPLTLLDYKIMLKKFYRHMLGDGSRAPPAVAWIRLSASLEPTVDPSQILLEEDVLQLIQAQDAQNHLWARVRNKALIAFLYDSGVRMGELLSMRIADVTIGSGLWHVTVRGKTGQRTFPILTSIPYLKDYLAVHPRAQAGASLWCSLNDPSRSVSHNQVATTLRRGFRRAGVQKPANPHNFRHSAVSRDSSFMSDQQLKKKYGWTSSSRQLATYSHIRLEDLDNSYRQQYGLEEVKTESKMLTKPCPFCGAENRPHEQFCSTCKKPADLAQLMNAQRRSEALEQLTVELLRAVAAESPRVKETFRTLVKEKQLEWLFQESEAPASGPRD